jgi:hypothetical protein
LINRSPSTISRELRRNRDACGGYSARVAQQQMQARRQVCRPKRKLLPGSERFELVAHMLRERLSPEQIAGKLRSMNIPSLRDAYVCRETIYNAIYALPVGELRKELIICLRQSKTTRRPRSGGVDRRGQIPEMVSIHVRPPEIEDRLMPGHWEGDLIKGKANASSVGTLVERTSGYLMLVKMNDATATSAMEGFSAALNGMPLAMRKSMTRASASMRWRGCAGHSIRRTATRPQRSLPCCASSSNADAKRWPIWKCSWPPCRPSRHSTRRVCYEQSRAFADRNTQAVHRLSVGRVGRAHLSLSFADSRRCAGRNDSRRIHRGTLGYCSPHADRLIHSVRDAATAGLQGRDHERFHPAGWTTTELAQAASAGSLSCTTSRWSICAVVGLSARKRCCAGGIRAWTVATGPVPAAWPNRPA